MQTAQAPLRFFMKISSMSRSGPTASTYVVPTGGCHRQIHILEEVVVMHTEVLSRSSTTFRARTLSKIRPIVAVAAAVGVLAVVAASPASAAEAKPFTCLL